MNAVKKTEFVNAFPIKDKIDDEVADELVVFDKAQVLPLFLVYV